MFRAAFPSASEEQERAEMAWIKANYDTSGANGGNKDTNSRVRFAGTWASPDVAYTIAHTYAIDRVIEHLGRATPSPDVAYRSAAKGGADDGSNKQLPTPAPSATNALEAQPPAKRRKEATPTPASPAPATPAKPASRRSTRLSRSPAPASQIPAPRARTPRRRAQRDEPRSDHTDHTLVDEEQTDALVKPTMLEDIQEQRELIEDLKAKRHAEQLAKAAAEAEEAEGGAEEEGEAGQATKRAREEEEPLQFNFQDPTAKTNEVTERAIATNRRVGRLPQMSTRNKQVAWGALAFAAGLGAV
jgi:hypothetical protein